MLPHVEIAPGKQEFAGMDCVVRGVRVDEVELKSGALAVVQSADGSLEADFIGEGGVSLSTLRWVPGGALSAWTVPLTERVTEAPWAAGIAGRFLSLSGGGEQLAMIERSTGRVHRLQPVPSPAVALPMPAAVVAVTTQGLLSYGLRLEGTGAPETGWVGPLAIVETDTPRSALVVPGPEAGRFVVAIGGYGSVSLVKVSKIAPAITTVGAPDNAGLPYDPLALALPAPLMAGQGRYGFVHDQGRAGVGAIALDTGLATEFPQTRNAYNSVGGVVPEISGRAAIVYFRSGWLLWMPGAVPLPLKLAGEPVLFEGDRVVVLKKGVLKEITIRQG